MSQIADFLRTRLENALIVEMQRVNSELRAKAPIPDGTAPPLEELQRILADLQKRQPRRHPHLRTFAGHPGSRGRRGRHERGGQNAQ